jgi:L-cysteine/cystine lyase
MTNSPLSAADVTRIRQDLPAVQQVRYLNAGSLGPLPRPAIEAMARVREYDEGTRQGADHWDRLAALQQEARARLAQLVGTSSTQVALMHTTHEALNACLWGLELEPGESIVTTDEEHPGLLVPLRHLRARCGTEVRSAPWGGDDDAFVDALLGQVGPRTRAVALSHVSWSSGRIAPLRAIADALPGQVRLVVDGAQSAGVLPIDPADGWHAYTVSGQKWPCGPNGSGALVLQDPEAWAPTFGAYMQVTDHEEILTSGVVATAGRFEQSQEALEPLAGIAASLQWLDEVVGIARAQAHARALNARARAGLELAGVDPARLHGHAHLLAIDTPDRGAMATSAALLDDGTLVRPVGDTRIRASFAAWNTPAEVDALVRQLTPHLTAPPR